MYACMYLCTVPGSRFQRPEMAFPWNLRTRWRQRWMRWISSRSPRPAREHGAGPRMASRLSHWCHRSSQALLMMKAAMMEAVKAAMMKAGLTSQCWRRSGLSVRQGPGVASHHLRVRQGPGVASHHLRLIQLTWARSAWRSLHSERMHLVPRAAAEHPARHFASSTSMRVSTTRQRAISIT